MKSIRKRLTYSNVMSSIAVFLVLGGAAFAAAKLPKNSVGTKQLKKNAVTAAKIKKGAVTGAKLGNGAVTESKLGNGAVTNSKLGDASVGNSKIQNGAVNGDKVADGSLSGADINAGSTPFSQITARIRNGGPINLQTVASSPIGSYTQPAGEDDLYVAGLDVNFLASCTQPRSVAVYLTLDPENPFALENIVGFGVVSDKSAGAVTKRLEFGDYGITGSGGLHRMGLASAQNHTFYAFPAGSSCNSGSGITGSNLGVDVIGTK